ncbi:MAG: DUF4176 domain-containing protein [Atopobiaceae bacterium]|nr:DUF4176 domain-containing protein [Atopobiaceae bacterium]
MELESLLPLGSVIVPEGEPDSRFMIIGYFPETKEASYDYLVTPYPQGMFEVPITTPMNCDSIQHVEYRGYETEQIRELLDATLDYMKEKAHVDMELARKVSEFAEENPEEFERIMIETFVDGQPESFGLE